MTVVVLDASAALAWLLPSQMTNAANGLLAQADSIDFIAPHVFLWEVANVLAAKARRQGIVPVEALKRLDEVQISFDSAPDRERIPALMQVAMVAEVSLFDAAYLTLALEQGAGLASRDGALLTAAVAAGVDVFDLRD